MAKSTVNLNIQQIAKTDGDLFLERFSYTHKYIEEAFKHICVTYLKVKRNVVN